MATFYERQQAEWAAKYGRYTEAMLVRRIETLNKQIKAKAASAETARWDRRGKGQRLQSTREQRAHAAGRLLFSEQNYVADLLRKLRANIAAEAAKDATGE